MNKERYVAAVEVSSSKIMAVVGKVSDDGQVAVIATEQERGVEGVRYGIVQNLEETAMRIARILEKLQRKPAVAPRQITSVFVGLSGRSLHSISTKVSQTLPNEMEITQDILDRLYQQALATDIDASLCVVDAIPRTYTIGKYETQSPKGTIGNDIRAVYDLIVCRPEMQRNLTRTLSEKTAVDIKGFIVTALSTAQIILSSEEKRQGCMLVDMGAETTTVSIYKNGHLAYFATLPMGGRNITRDITSLGVLEEKAEEIKVTSGNAIALESQTSLNLGGLKMSEVSGIIVARAEEIVGQHHRTDQLRGPQGERSPRRSDMHRRRFQTQRHHRPACQQDGAPRAPRPAASLHSDAGFTHTGFRRHPGRQHPLRRSHQFHRRMSGDPGYRRPSDRRNCQRRSSDASEAGRTEADHPRLAVSYRR